MIPVMRLALLGGCVIVTALVSPTSARVVAEDFLGPHALRPASAAGLDPAHIPSDELAAFVEATSDDEQNGAERKGAEPYGAGPRVDERTGVDHEAGHDAP
jgi:hypothetical protein